MPVEGLRRIDAEHVEVPKGYRAGMRVPGLVFVDESLERGLDERSVGQVANVAMLPGIVGASMAMPDIHAGYGFPIGGVAAFDVRDGIISPGGVGYDINCGVRLLRSDLTHEDMAPRLREVVTSLYGAIPAGVGSKGRLRLGREDERKVLREGAGWVVSQGMGEPEDLERAESNGRLEGADPTLISEKAFERGRAQQGTLGSGNHFIEVQHVDEVYDPEAAGALGLFPGQVTVMIHTGSRGFGHQVCTDFLEVMHRAASKYRISLPDAELVCAPFGSPEARDYLTAMRAAANYAWANRQAITHWTRETFMHAFG
jgi:tRNA-splicing ligase RtcB